MPRIMLCLSWKRAFDGFGKLSDLSHRIVKLVRPGCDGDGDMALN